MIIFKKLQILQMTGLTVDSKNHFCHVKNSINWPTVIVMDFIKLFKTITSWA